MKRFFFATIFLALCFVPVLAADKQIVLDEKIPDVRQFTFQRPSISLVYKGEYRQVEIFKYYVDKKFWTSTNMIVEHGRAVTIDLGRKGVYGLTARPVLDGVRPALRDDEAPRVFVTIMNNQDDSVVEADGLEIKAVLGATQTAAGAYQTRGREIQVEVADGLVAAGQKLTLWRQSNGEVPIRLGETDGTIRTFRVENLDDGVHYFMVLAGEIPKRFKPNFMLVVDTQAPIVKIIGQFNRYYGAGENIQINFDVRDTNLDPESVTVYVKRFGDPKYQVLESAVKSLTEHTFVNTLPSGVYSVKVSAKDKLGNYAEDELRRAFAVDTVAPVASVMGVLQSYTQEVALSYTATDEGGSGLKRIEVWTTVDDGRSWQITAFDEELKAVTSVDLPQGDGGSVPIDEPKYRLAAAMPGDEVGVMIVAVDQAGNRQPGPQPGTSPRYWFRRILREPAVLFAGFPDRQVFIGGDEVVLTFRQTQILPDKAVVEFSADGGMTWITAIRINPAAVKPMHWRIPPLASRNARLRIVSTYPDGSQGIDVSDPFVVSSDAPAVALNEDAGGFRRGDIALAAAYGHDEPVPDGRQQVVGKVDAENDFDQQMELGYKAYREKKFALASKFFRRATELRPDSYKAHFELGRTYYRSNPGLSSEERDRANLASLNEFQKAIKINPASDEAFNEIGVMYFEDMQFEKAAYYFGEAVKIKDSAIYNYNTGLALFKAERYARAKPFFVRAIQLDQSQKQSFWYLAKVGENLKENGKLVEDYWQKVADAYGATSNQGVYALRQIRMIREGDDRGVFTRAWLWTKELFFFNTF